MLVELRHELQGSELHILVISQQEENVGSGISGVDFTGANTVETKHQQREKMMKHHLSDNIVGIDRRGSGYLMIKSLDKISEMSSYVK